MAGRGRGVNLPAWMTASGAKPPSEGPGPGPAAASPAASTSGPSGPGAPAAAPGPSASTTPASAAGPPPTSHPPPAFGGMPPAANGNPAFARPPPQMGMNPMMGRGPPMGGHMMPPPNMGMMPRPMHMGGGPPYGMPPMGGWAPPNGGPMGGMPPGGMVAPMTPTAEWKEYKDNTGRPYYHNQQTNTTTYEKPEALKSIGERTLPPCKWKEYPTKDGKMYYSDGVNSVWSEPAELTAYKAQVAAMEKAGGGKAAASGPPSASATTTTATAANDSATATATPSTAAATPATTVAANAAGGAASTETTATPAVVPPVVEPPRKKRAPPPEAVKPLVFNSQEERVEAFTSLLLEMEITSTSKWGEVNRLCNQDPRWAALKTMGQKKQFFAEWQTRRMKEEKEERRLNLKKARDKFLKMLAEDTTIDMKTRWREAQTRLLDDERYKLLEDDREREELFNDFVVELARKDDEEKRVLRKMRFDAYMVFLKEFPEITHLTRWVEIRTVLEEKKDPRFDALDESERRHNFQDLVTELRKVAEAERQEREKEKREKEKANRDAFRECLKQKVAEGVINAGSKWRDMKNDLEKEPVYLAMEGQAGSTTREIFEDVVDELAQLYRADRKYLRDLASDMSFTHETSYEDYLKGMKKEEEAVEESKRKLDKLIEDVEIHVRLYYEELHAKELALYEDEQRHKKRREERYQHLLEDYYYRSDHIGIPWKEAEYDLNRHSAYRELKEPDRIRLFDEYMESLAKKMGKVKPTADADGADSEDKPSSTSKSSSKDDSAAADHGDAKPAASDAASSSASENAAASTSMEDSTNSAKEDGEVEDGEIGSKDDEPQDNGRGHRKRDRKEKKKRKKKSRSESGSDDDEDSDGDEDHKRAKKKKSSSRKEKKRSRRSSEDGEEDDEGGEGGGKKHRA